jgi:hypothetical protein
MRHNAMLAVLLVATALVGPRHAFAGQSPAAASVYIGLNCSNIGTDRSSFKRTLRNPLRDAQRGMSRPMLN